MAGVSNKRLPGLTDCHRSWKALLPFMTSVAIGAIAWNGVGADAAAIAALLLPPLWARSTSRLAGTGIALAYFSGASWPLLMGGVVYFDSIMMGTGIWLAAAIIWVIPWLICWGASYQGMRVVAVLVIAAVPPFGIVGWASPLLAAGVCFPCCGTLGLILTLFSCAFITNMAIDRLWQGLAILSVMAMASCLTSSPAADDLIQGVNTHAGSVRDEYLSVWAFDRELLRAVIAAPTGADLVFPEAALAAPRTARPLLKKSLRLAGDKQLRIYVGAGERSNDGPRNVVENLNTGEVVVESRLPPPGSMWRPWTNASYPMHLLEPGISSVWHGNTAIFICYETVLVWPGTLSSLAQPERVIVVANLWFDQSGYIERAERQAARLWARLWGATLTMAVNR